jgi:GxxExxY protein
MRDPVTDRVIGCCFKVHKALGAGFLEKVYENALLIELEKCNLAVRQQFPIAVRYEDRVVGEYFADLLIEGRIICELKASEMLSREHEVQLVNYLAATGLDVGLLVNFGRSVTVRRKFREYRVGAKPQTSARLSYEGF